MHWSADIRDIILDKETKMKKFYICILSIIIAFSLFACSTEKNYKILEVGGYDNLSGAKHSEEFEIELKAKEKIFVSKEKNISFNNSEYAVEYDMTAESYLYRTEIDYYEKKESGKRVKFGINTKTGNIDRYSLMDVNYIKEITKSELSRDECLEIAWNYLAKYIDTKDYELVDEKYRDIPEYKAIYDFEFRRVIDGIQTSDCAYIEVTVFGDVVDHMFISLGEMADAELPSDEDMQTIRTKVEEKLKTIYGNVSDKYTVSYEIPDPVFVRLSDGKYAFEYDIDVSLAPHDNPDMPISELTKLLVYLD